MRQLASDLWTADRPQRFYGLEVGTRMTVMRLADGSLLLHSPVALAARELPGVSANPDGAACYDALLRSYTTLSRPAAEVAALGERVVAASGAEAVARGRALYGTSTLAELMARLAADPSNRYPDTDEVLADSRRIVEPGAGGDAALFRPRTRPGGRRRAEPGLRGRRRGELALQAAAARRHAGQVHDLAAAPGRHHAQRGGDRRLPRDLAGPPPALRLLAADRGAASGAPAGLGWTRKVGP